MKTQVKSRFTKTEIAGTLYIVESMTSNGASETAESKVKRLILSNFKPNKFTDNAQHPLTSSRK